MNDTELDQALNQWQAPEPPSSLRAGLRARFPRAGRRLGRPLRWLLAVALASAALVAMAQTGDRGWDSTFVRALTQLYQHVADALEIHRVQAIVWKIRGSDNRTFIDGNPAPPLEFRHSISFDLPVPGEGVYAITFGAMVRKDWVQAGSIHGSTIEFQAGAHHVVVQCSAPLGGDGVPVFVRRRE